MVNVGIVSLLKRVPQGRLLSTASARIERSTHPTWRKPFKRRE
jgi:hypothetical protein